MRIKANDFRVKHKCCIVFCDETLLWGGREGAQIHQDTGNMNCEGKCLSETCTCMGKRMCLSSNMCVAQNLKILPRTQGNAIAFHGKNNNCVYLCIFLYPSISMNYTNLVVMPFFSIESKCQKFCQYLQFISILCLNQY